MLPIALLFLWYKNPTHWYFTAITSDIGVPFKAHTLFSAYRYSSHKSGTHPVNHKKGKTFPLTQASVLPFKNTPTTEVTSDHDKALSPIFKTNTQAQRPMAVFYQHGCLTVWTRTGISVVKVWCFTNALLTFGFKIIPSYPSAQALQPFTQFTQRDCITNKSRPHFQKMKKY